MVKSTKAAEPENHIAVFQESSIRRVWHNDEWWFSVADVCAILTASPDGGAYWRKLKQRLNAEGSQPVTFCHGLKLLAPDGKQRETDCANTEGLFRIIKSIPSPKAETFKRWLAQAWIEKRLRSISVRGERTDGQLKKLDQVKTGNKLRDHMKVSRSDGA